MEHDIILVERIMQEGHLFVLDNDGMAMDKTFWLPGRTAGVQDVERVVVRHSGKVQGIPWF